MEFEMHIDGFNIGRVIFDLNNIPFKREGLTMGHLPSSYRIQLHYEKSEEELNKEILKLRKQLKASEETITKIIRYHRPVRVDGESCPICEALFAYGDFLNELEK